MDNTQTHVPQPPRAITTKDILYLKDALSWELLAFKKFHFLAQHAENQEIKDALDNAGKMHQDHYQRLLSHLQVNNDQALASFNNQSQH
jgi:hypothetical protein